MLPLPFYQMRVLDFTTDLAGAYATRFFADLGAEAIKVEDARMPDALRADPLPFESLQRNKLSFAVDTATDAGRSLCLRLARACDFAFINAGDTRFQPDDVTADDDNLILVVIDDEGVSPAETGVAAAAGALTALLHRRQTGLAQSVSVDGASVQGSLRFLAPDARPRDLSSLVADPQLKQDGFFETIARHAGDFVTVDGVPYRFGRTPAHVRLPAPRPGEHSELVLKRYLGLDADAIASLSSQGVIAAPVSSRY
jgi:crotonobetainyl-CoA:carnitine CoA-transferase CaiB-like acyl-CoA transferase